MPRAVDTGERSRESSWLTYLAASLALAMAFIVATAQPGGERDNPDQTEVLGVQLERSGLPVAVPAVSTVPSPPAGDDRVALPGGAGGGGRSLDPNWEVGLTLLAAGLLGLGLVAASNPHRRRTAVGPPA